jgi:hypothetical protein
MRKLFEERPMRRSIGWSMTVWFLVGLWVPSALAMTAVKRTLNDLVRLSDLVLIGTVKRIESAREPTSGKIYTYMTLSDLMVIKGDLRSNEYVLRLRGGVVDGMAEMYPGRPQFEEAKRYLIFVRGNFREFFPVVGMHQGVFHVEWDPERQQEVVRPFRGHVISAGNSGQLQQGQEELPTPTESVTVEQFVQRIQEQLRALEPGRQDNPDGSGSANPASSGGTTR